MSKSSTISARQSPPRDGRSAAGMLSIHAEAITIDTSERVELVDLTERLTALVRTANIADGLVSVWSMHTTCAVFINENQAALHADIKQFLETTVSRHGAWMHNDPEHSDCDRNNADAHLRAILLGHSMTLQVAGGELVLGQWQRVLAAELDGPRSRTFRVHVQGISSVGRGE
ncbi:MAG TPA: secondary thiamine-phosphate synthase enzyme YjbQ [Vicinamibacterales bacterium]|nr:secondary thiamine-phosphate synthase enzyme YjbQ [Vicinamibacterales bacterium]